MADERMRIMKILERRKAPVNPVFLSNEIQNEKKKQKHG